MKKILYIIRILVGYYVKIYNTIISDVVSPGNIKDIRASYGLTQQKFAVLLDISVRTLQNYEIGHRKPFGPANALLIIADKHTEVFLNKRAKIPKSRMIAQEILRELKRK